VINVTALVTLDKADLDSPVGHVPEHLMVAVDDGLRLTLDL
jgi:mRNA-degrading endonuclease toxin of MazEF toxin-antitoxin module